MRFFLLALLLLPVAGLAAAESTLPVAFSSERYSSMGEQSPFVLATIVEAPKAPTESFAANWELTGIAKLRDDKGVDRWFVSIRSRDRRVTFTLNGDEESRDPDAKGVSIATVDRVPTARKSTVTLKRGNETAKVEFGQESAPQAAAQPQQMRTGAVQQMPNGVPAAYNAAAGMNALGANRGISQVRPPGAGQPPGVVMPNQGIQPGTTLGAPNPGLVNPAAIEPPKRRVRVINSR